MDDTFKWRTQINGKGGLISSLNFIALKGSETRPNQIKWNVEGNPHTRPPIQDSEDRTPSRFKNFKIDYDW